MAKVGIPVLFLFSMFFLALPNELPLMPEQLPATRPICATQFSLLNYACARVPLVPLPPPTPPPALPPPTPLESGHRNGHRHGHRQGQGHGHGHGHGNGHGHHGTPEQRDCCRWLKMVDIECVCDILVHLPTFLSRPNHQYTVALGETCSVTYSCGGRLRP